MASVMVSNETQSQASRVTKEGKRITYRMHVIQQPERARACGSGAKSSADRRPVDPPPIVELRVYEGEGNALQDITFSYNANFFLFATLENARVVAQGRVPTSPASFPVLTGTPVAGMAYLDRPNPAGYFIFPDLSVRHEGRYRLSFALYEELKNQNDMDPEDRQSVEVQRPGIIDAHVSHRLEVKSAPFTVFSAKKFPGLTESTALSRMVAEQGCRVRIRRDVRMRRRDTKSNKEWDDYEDETAYERARRTATPDGYSQQNISTPGPIPDGLERPRSVSNASNASYAPQRRPSLQEMAQGYQQGYPPQAPQQPQQNGYSSQMQYGNTPSHSYQSQFPPPQQQQQAPNMMQPPQAPYQSGPSHAYQQPPPQPQQNMQMAPPYGYMSTPSYNQPGYEQADHMRHNNVEYANNGSEYRSNTISQPAPSQFPASNQMIPSFGGLDNASNRPSQASQPQQLQPLNQNTPSSTPTHPISSHSLAPLKTLQPPSERIEPASPSFVTSGQMSANSDSMHGQQFVDSQRSKFTQPSQSTATKRSFSESFDSKHLHEPLRQGARPNFSHSMDDYMPGLEEGDEEPMDERAMSYRRADGSQRMRRMPIPNE